MWNGMCWCFVNGRTNSTYIHMEFISDNVYLLASAIFSTPDHGAQLCKTKFSTPWDFCASQNNRIVEILAEISDGALVRWADKLSRRHKAKHKNAIKTLGLSHRVQNESETARCGAAKNTRKHRLNHSQGIYCQIGRVRNSLYCFSPSHFVSALFSFSFEITLDAKSNETGRWSMTWKSPPIYFMQKKMF